MATIKWAEPALEQLDDIAGYIALDNPEAAKRLVGKIFDRVDRLKAFPESGRMPPELPNSVYRDLLVRPCRLFYRREGSRVLIIHVMRDERVLRCYLLNDPAEPWDWGDA